VPIAHGAGSNLAGARHGAPTAGRDAAGGTPGRSKAIPGSGAGTGRPTTGPAATTNHRSHEARPTIIEINVANFPPLQPHAPSTPDEVPTPGYPGAFVKYNFDEIVAIVRDVKDVSIPETIKLVSHSVRQSGSD
jgi:hypothetical protein